MQMACRLLEVAESGYYEWRSRPPSARAVRHAWLTEQIRAVHTASRGIYGARRVHAELTLGLGLQVGHNQVEMLMARAAIKGLPGNRRPRPRHETPTASDLVERMFTREAPNRLWVTDITEHRTYEGKVYCAVVLDTFSRRVVGWSIDSSQTAALVTNALGHGHRQPRPAGRRDHPLRPRRAVHLLGLHRPGQTLGSGSVDGVDRRLLRQRHDRILLGQNANRATQPQTMEDAHRAGQRDLRLPGDLPQPPTASFRPRHAHSDRVRTATPIRPTRGLKPSMATLGNPGHIKLRIKRGRVQDDLSRVSMAK